MAFRKPENDRNNSSGKSSGGYKKTNSDRKTTSSSRSRTAGPGFEKADGNGPKKRYGAEKSDDKKPYQSRGKSSSFSKDSNTDRPARKYGSPASGEKKPFAAPGRKPSADRFSKPGADDRRKKTFGADSEGDRKTTGFNRAPQAARASKSFDDRPKGRFSSDAPAGKSFAPRTRSTFGDAGAEKGPGRPTERSGFKRPAGGDFKDKPFRKTERTENDRPPREKRENSDRVAPERTMRSRKNSPVEHDDKGLIRLNRYISNAGICSRRKADELIVAGVISVNGEVISELGFKVDPMKDQVRYNGEMLKREKMVYVLLNKPKDYITTTDDPQERRTVMQLVEKASRERIYPVGRLDRNTTGLLLMTNDGDLADKLAHPRNSITKIYQVELNKALTQGDLNKISFGLELEDGLIKPDMVSYVAGGTKKEIGIQIHSGKNRIVRRIFEHLGYDVVKLDRAVYANLNKKDLPRGRWRYLEEQEIIQLKHLIK